MDPAPPPSSDSPPQEDAGDHNPSAGETPASKTSASKTPHAAWDEPAYRRCAAALYRKILTAFDEVDPDEVECEEAQGALTIRLQDGAQWVVSQQPPTRQIWLAVASIGRAYHFDYHPHDASWRVSREPAVELLTLLRKLLRENAGVDLPALDA